MPSVSGPQFSVDPEGESKRFVAQLQAEAAVLSIAPPRYEWQSGYWCAVKSNTGWPNVTGWAEHRETQRIFSARFDELMAEGVSEHEAWKQADDHSLAEMLIRTTERKEASDRYYAELEADTAHEAGEDRARDEPTD
ncbi:hypothetical protein [Prescottella agglutinans]|uniref:Uncharacterized protein n=1 Tax=Prescottella agglutinans TaxID=1644129 RepID=A0ABT6MMT0_9NOCA|nr:hypothetical protein [Prescottella agglutinans]MDH6284949.1 hypothetical protein [Prescottella agglutinans]